MSAPTPNTNYVTGGAIGIDITNTGSACNYTPGQSHIGSNGTEWVYAMAPSALNQGALVALSGGSLATAVTGAGLLGSSTLSVRYAFAQTAFAASTWGFMAVRGSKVLIRMGSAAGVDAPLYTTDTAGVLSATTATASQFQIFGVSLEASVSASGATATVATANISFPIARRPHLAV